MKTKIIILTTFFALLFFNTACKKEEIRTIADCDEYSTSAARAAYLGELINLISNSKFFNAIGATNLGRNAVDGGNSNGALPLNDDDVCNIQKAYGSLESLIPQTASYAWSQITNPIPGYQVDIKGGSEKLRYIILSKSLGKVATVSVYSNSTGKLLREGDIKAN